MRKIFVLLLVIISVSLFSQQLWKITHPKSKNVSYILGTHHLVPATYLDSIKGVYKAYNNTKYVVGEIALEDSDLNEKLTAAFALPDTLSLENFFSEEQLIDISIEFGKLTKMPLSSLSKMKPAMIGNIYLMALYHSVYPEEKDILLIDNYFQQVASEQNRPILGLESVQEQIAILYNSKSFQAQADDLINLINKREQYKQALIKMTKLYKEGNLDELYTFCTTDEIGRSGATDEELRILMDNRNVKWVETLTSILPNKSCFIAVGALHLPSEKGILHLLKKSGYRVQPVK